jgi:hypothetical protein
MCAVSLLCSECLNLFWNVLLHCHCLFSGEEFDDVHIPDERQEPQQVAQREAISQVAQQLRTLGDQYTEQHGNNFTVSHVQLY